MEICLHTLIILKNYTRHQYVIIVWIPKELALKVMVMYHSYGML